MKEITITAYSVSELSDKAKDHAYNKWLEHHDYPWGSENEATLKAFAEAFGIKIASWSYGDRGSHVSFDMEREYSEQEELSGIRLMGHLYHNYFSEMFKGKYYGELVYTHKDGTPIEKSKEHPAGCRHIKRYSKVLFEDSCVLTGYCIDDDIMGPIYEFLKKPEATTTFRELMDDCFDAWIRACEADYEYSTSQEYFEEECEQNEWMFDENGRKI